MAVNLEQELIREKKSRRDKELMVTGLMVERSQLEHRIAALEARVSELQDECVRFVAELDPWRQMARQLEAMVANGCQLDLKVISNAWVGEEAIVDNMPAAVAAAYEQVMGVGDE